MLNHEERITRSSFCGYSNAYILVKGTITEPLHLKVQQIMPPIKS